MKRVGLLMGLRRPPQWEAIVHALVGAADVHYAADPLTEPMDAWLASSPTVPGLSRAVASGVPVAVVTDEDCPGVIRITSMPGPVFFPADGLDATARAPVPPFVRARWRRKAGLPDVLVVRTDDDRLPGDLVPTALALAAAVIAEGRLVLEALAWGAPCVTDAASAAACGAEADRDLMVAPSLGADADGAARELAGDVRRAAALGRAGRRLVERSYDTSRAGQAVRRALGLEPPAVDRRARVARALDELWAPAGAPISHRAAALVEAGAG
jgi:hypothetical protein